MSPAWAAKNAPRFLATVARPPLILARQKMSSRLLLVTHNDRATAICLSKAAPFALPIPGFTFVSPANVHLAQPAASRHNPRRLIANGKRHDVKLLEILGHVQPLANNAPVKLHGGIVHKHN